MRKILLVIIMIGILVIAGCDSGNSSSQKDKIDYLKDMPQMTTENIQLTYVTCESDKLARELARKFEKEYPNIKVNVISVGKEYLEETIKAINENNQSLDCFIYTDCDDMLSNNYLYDMTEYWEADKENSNLIPSIDEAKLGYFGTDSKLATPMVYYPGIFYVSKPTIEKLWMDMPDLDWTWEEMIKIIKEATRVFSKEQHYGLCSYKKIYEYYDVAMSLSSIGPMGYDGHTFNLDNWVKGVKQYQELMDTGCIVGPHIDEDDMWSCGSIWMGESGQVAILLEEFYAYLNHIDIEYSYNLGYVPYVIPTKKGIQGEEAYTTCTMYMGGISSNSAHPREAYELLKFMGWGVDGWKARLEIYKDETIVCEQTMEPLYRSYMPAPLTLDEGIWIEYKKFFYDGAENIRYWDYYFDNCLRGIPDGICSIPGYSKFHKEYFGTYELKEEFYDSIDSGQIDIDILAAEIEAKLEQYHKEAMKEYFDIDISD